MLTFARATVLATLTLPLAGGLAAADGPLVREYHFEDDPIEGELVRPARPCVPAAAQHIELDDVVCGAAGKTDPTMTDAEAWTPTGNDHLYAGDGLYRPPIEWSTWLRVAYGTERTTQLAIPRSVGPTAPVTHDRHGTFDGALGIEASLPLSRHGDLRAGAWLEQRGLSLDATFAGVEAILTRVPRTLDMFLYEGHGILAIRAGRSRDDATASIAYGYLAPFWLEGPCRMRFYGIYTGVCHERPERTARYMAGVRVVATVTRGLDSPRDWSATLGLEFEPVGALRMITIARSWYRN